MRAPHAVLAYISLVSSACFEPEPSCREGEEHCSCFVNQTCLGDLQCVGGLCLASSTTSTTTMTTTTTTTTTDITGSDAASAPTSTDAATTGATAAEDSSSESSVGSATTSSSGDEADDSTTLGGAESTGESEASSTGSAFQGYAFFDDFERPDGSNLGGQWFEKNPPLFSIEAGRVVLQGQTDDYRNNLVLRPFEESVLNGEVSVVFRTSDAVAPGNPQVFVRVQPESFEEWDTAIGYLCFITMRENLGLRMRRLGPEGTQTTDLGTADLDDDLIADDDYRIRFRAVGANPVVLSCVLEHASDGSWVTIQSLESGDNEITEPGVMGFSADGVAMQRYDYDDFRAIELAP